VVAFVFLAFVFVFSDVVAIFLKLMRRGFGMKGLLIVRRVLVNDLFFKEGEEHVGKLFTHDSIIHEDRFGSFFESNLKDDRQG
jgi:hypothetical protein